jgi:hypothetical protein
MSIRESADFRRAFLTVFTAEGLTAALSRCRLLWPLPGFIIERGRSVISKLVIFLAIVAGFSSVAWAQLSDTELQRRMDELNKRSTTRPVATAAKPPVPQPQRYFKWRAKPNAPQAVKDWVGSFDVLRGALISEIDAELEGEALSGQREEARLREETKEAEAEVSKIKSRPITVETRRSGAFIQQIPDAREVAIQKQDLKEAEDAVAKLKKRRAELLRTKFLSADGQKLVAQKEKLSDPSQIPITQLRLVRGRVGYLTEPVAISYVVDERNFVARFGRLPVWISDMDTAGLKNGAMKNIAVPMRVTGTKTSGNVASAEREMYVLAPFEYAQYIEQAEVDAPPTVESGVALSKPFGSVAELVIEMPRSAGDDPLRMTTLQQQEFPAWLEKNALGRGLLAHVTISDVMPEKGKGIIVHGMGSARLDNGQEVPYRIAAQFGEDQRPLLLALKEGANQRITGVIKEVTMVRPRIRPGETPDPTRLVIVMIDCRLGAL